MNNLAVIAGIITRKVNGNIGTRQAVNLTIKTSIEVNGGKTISSFIPVQITMPTMVERCKTIQEGTRVTIEGRFETYTTSDGRKGYNIVQISLFQIIDEGDMNHVVTWGRVTQDPVIRFTQSQKEVARLNIANSRSYKKEEEWVEVTSFIPVTAWGAVASVAEKLQKGDAVWVIGKIISGSYVNRDGQKIYTMEINADSIVYGGSGRRNIVESGQGQVQQKPAQYQNHAGQQNYQPNYNKQQQNGQQQNRQPQNSYQQAGYNNVSSQPDNGLPPFPESGGYSNYGNMPANPPMNQPSKPTSAPGSSNGFINLDNFDEDEELPFP